VGRIYRLAEQVARGEATADVISAAQAEMISLLQLKDCRFEPAPFGESLPRLERSGVIADRREFRYARGGLELPREGVELEVLARGRPAGRFVLEATPGVGVSLEQRVVAVALADQVGGALAAGQSASPSPDASPNSRE
jgi:hypothetical protein